MKTCSRCKVGKEFDGFSKNTYMKDGFDNQCKSCKKDYRDSNKERLKESRGEKYPERRASRLAYHIEYYSRPENRAKKLYNQVRNRAKGRGQEFNLDITDIETPTHCKYLGCELVYDLGKGRQFNQASVDRIDSSKGYIKGNVQTISMRANLMKSDASQQELETFARSILKVM